jgi:hypothetical protein
MATTGTAARQAYGVVANHVMSLSVSAAGTYAEVCRRSGIVPRWLVVVVRYVTGLVPLLAAPRTGRATVEGTTQ